MLLHKLHEEVWSPGRSWRNVLQPSQLEGGQNCSAPVAKQTCKPVRTRCEDAGGNSRTICQGEFREQFLSSRWELSVARQALEGAQLAPGSLTLAALTKTDRRPSAPRESLGRGIEEHVPVERFVNKIGARVAHTLTELDEDATIVSVDGIEASSPGRQCLMDLLSVGRGEQLLPFVRSFYGAPSHRILQGEGEGTR